MGEAWPAVPGWCVMTQAQACDCAEQRLACSEQQQTGAMDPAACCCLMALGLCYSYQSSRRLCRGLLQARACAVKHLSAAVPHATAVASGCVCCAALGQVLARSRRQACLLAAALLGCHVLSMQHTHPQCMFAVCPGEYVALWLRPEAWPDTVRAGEWACGGDAGASGCTWEWPQQKQWDAAPARHVWRIARGPEA
jgi:hypothetical protein